MSDFWNIWASNSLNWLSKWQESKVALRFLKVYLHFTWMSRKWRPKFFGRHSITIYKWGTNKIFNNTRMVTGFTGFRRWLARLRVSSHILLSPVKTLFTMLVMLNTITSSCVNWVFFGMSGPTSAKKSPIYIRTSWIQSFFVRRPP
jgi:hypothetical protein